MSPLLLEQRSPTFLAPGTSLVEDNFSTDRWGGGQGSVSGGNASDAEPWGAADEASLARLPLTSCYAAWFLTGRRLALVPAGDPCTRVQARALLVFYY